MATVFKNYPKEKTAFLNPEDIIKRTPNFPELCVSTFSENIINEFFSGDNREIICEICTANGNIPIYEVDYKNKKIALFVSRIGAPACVAGIEEVIALGAKKFVLFGSCGILDEKIARGKVIIPTSAIRDEGVSYHYIEASDEIMADKNSVNVLAECSEKCGYPFVKGKIWTTDAIYRETHERIRERKSEGCIAVEMECASAMAVTQFRKVPFAQFLFGADSLDTTQWEQRDLTDYGLSDAKKYLKLAFECILAL